MKQTMAFGCAVFVLGAAGCGSDPVTRLESQYTATGNAVCARCPEAAGVLTAAECQARLAAENPFDGPEYDCARMAYQRYPSELGPYFDCLNGASSRYDTCIRGTLSSCPPAATATTACNEALTAGINACPIPTSVEAATALGACFR
jgi:hypothetical protein